ncbi:MAG: GNAT family N-acetyltransferase [Ruminococcus sp.]|uniref:GNAT family N-acetyltransferase n=1 Tax=Ruminococcus sp. TaxID=41978 RepID=UPI0028739B67|nr:GNAT family N-acetyltransferase [Ruminococcus sp.]MBQ3285460.1 GNAT family N-acetyltransferase [Ruminococcus sp.]
MKKKLFSEIPRLAGERITLRRLTQDDADGLSRLINSEEVYRYLPAYLFEKEYGDVHTVINRLYGECLKESLILGVFTENEFCGLAEIYGYRAPLLKASVGYRLLPEYWGKGIATETLGLLVKYLLEETDVEVITASTMIGNKASANVLKKNGFKRVIYAALENWGYKTPTAADKWLRTGVGYRRRYRFQ